MSDIVDNCIFKRKNNEYITRTNPISDYIMQSSLYISKKKNIPIKTAIQLVKKTLQETSINNPEVEYWYKKENGDRIVKKDKLTDYIKEVRSNNEILAPSFTSYIHPSIQRSIHYEFLNENTKKRSEDKRKAFAYKQQGDMENYEYYNTLQKTRKIFNNSLSGAYASKSTILYNPSAHYTLTSMTRSVASIGNAVTESMVAGNKHLRDPYVTMNLLIATVTEINHEHMGKVMEKYKIYAPTADEVMDMVLYSSRLYWKDVKKEKKIKEFLNTLNPIELASILYVNDLFHFKKYNQELMRTILKDLSTMKTTGSVDNLKDIKMAPDGVMNLVHHICSELIVGMEIQYDKLVGTELLNTLASTALYITNKLSIYKDLFRTFFTTNILPVSISYLKDMLRDSIVLSDTDSTCGAYDKWVEWYQGKLSFNLEGVQISAAVMTINTQVIDHNLKLLSKNMNIEEDKVDLLKMKNEFFWDVFTSTNVSKHYFANVRIQEGNVFSKPDLELKGVHLIASAVNPEIKKIGTGMIDVIHKSLANNKKVPLKELVNSVKNVEKKIISDITSGKIDIYKLEKIKNAESYKLDATKSPFIHHTFWESVFSEKYGSQGLPPYSVVKIPTTLNSKNDLNIFLDKLEDKDIEHKYRMFINKYKKDSFGTFRMPHMIAANNGVPKEILNIVDYKRVVLDNCNMLYLILESIGYARKPDLLISEMTV